MVEEVVKIQGSYYLVWVGVDIVKYELKEFFKSVVAEGGVWVGGGGGGGGGAVRGICLF